jgi:hypothetical protein
MFQRHLLNPEDKETMEKVPSMTDVMHSAVREFPLGRLGDQGRVLPLPRLPRKEVASNGAESILASGDNLTDLQNFTKPSGASKPVVVTDLQDPLWEPYRGVAELCGFRACWSTPVLAHSGKWAHLPLGR